MNETPDRSSRITIDDVAREAGVSVATVSRAVRGLPNVAEGTRQKVVEVAARLDYHADPIASRLASGRTMTVALLAAWPGQWHTGVTIAGAEELLSANGYDLLIASSGSAETVRSLESRVDGLLTIDLFHDPSDGPEGRTHRLPTVTIGEHVPDHSGITIPNQLAGQRASEHLLELGHRRIAVMTSPPDHDSPVSRLRLLGHRTALAAAGIDIDAELVVDGGSSIRGGRGSMGRLLELPNPPTAVFCFSDLMAFGALQACREAGIEVPEHMSIVGFDDHEASEPFGLTTMGQNVRGIGSRAAELLLERLTDPDSPIRHEEAPVELIERSSTTRS